MSAQAEATPTARDEELRPALAQAHVPTLVLVVHQLTGDPVWLSERYRPTRARGMDDHDGGGLAPDAQAELRKAAFSAIVAGRESRLEPEQTTPPSPERIAELLAIALCDEIPAAYGELLAEEMGTRSRSVPAIPDAAATDLDVLVIGAGMSGINVAIELQRTGIPFTVIEKNETVGGTWLENHYPGCGVDTPSHLYSFSFAQRPDWERYYAGRGQLAAYFESLADEHGVRDRIRFGCEVLGAEWDSAGARWRVRVRSPDGTAETVTPRVLISAVGHFNRPKIPQIEGLETFPGPCMHTARWDDSVDVAGRRVAVIGTGASSMQLVPALAVTAEQVLVFQGSRQWVIPSPNHGRAVSPEVRYLLEHVPFYAGWYRLWHFWRFGDRVHPALIIDPSYPDDGLAVSEVNARHRRALIRYAESELGGDSELVAACIPDYPPYARRPLFDHGWYRTIRRDDVELIEGRVSEISGRTLITSDGRSLDADVLALATGFRTLEMLGPLAPAIVGRSGRTLRETWGEDEARAHLGITVPGFPNFFILFGPNTNTGHGGSAFLTTEMQVRYVVKLLAAMAERGVASAECRQEVYDGYARELDAALERTVYSHPRAHGYYRNRNGRIIGSSPWTYLDYWRRTLEPDLTEFVLDGRP